MTQKELDAMGEKVRLAHENLKSVKKKCALEIQVAKLAHERLSDEFRAAKRAFSEGR